MLCTVTRQIRNNSSQTASESPGWLVKPQHQPQSFFTLMVEKKRGKSGPDNLHIDKLPGEVDDSVSETMPREILL